MEVLQGDQSGAGHDRRARDREAGTSRALDWSTRPSDILLFPHSPLALADILSHESGRLDLLPVPPAGSGAASEPATENALVESGSKTPVVPLQQRRRHRHPRERVNLLTRHGEAELLERCRGLLVENALVKGPGERQLFLAAGFVTWPDADQPSLRRRAPLLLYPVLLARLADGEGYELRLDGAHPFGNDSLREALHADHEIALPPPDPESPLADYLALVASRMAGCATLELDFDIALGSADVPRPKEVVVEKPRLPETPPAFDAPLAAEIAGTLSLRELTAVLYLLPDYELSPSAPEASRDAGIARLREYAIRLAAEGLADVEFRHIGALSESLERWRETITGALSTSSVVTLVGEGSIGARHLVQLAGIIELLDKAPLFIDGYAHPDLCFRATTTLLRRARHQARLIEDELTALQERFVLDKVPAKRQLLSLIEELGGSVGSEPDIVDADYFNARRRFMEFSIDKPAHLTPEHRRALGQLAKVLRFRELFVNNVEYRAALGPGYRGLRTDWEALESVSEYARELAEILGSETLAAAAIGAWPTFRRAFVMELETLQGAAEATRRLLLIGGARWQSRPVEELVEHAADLGERLLRWHLDYGDVVTHAARTPASLLERFTGREREDLMTESRVAEAQRRIAAGVTERGLSAGAIADTLRWLREASETAERHSLGAEAISAHLASS